MGQFKVGDRGQESEGAAPTAAAAPARVDVIAVMERDARRSRREYENGLRSYSNPDTHAKLLAAAEKAEAALAAVRELIEAAAKLRADVYLWRLTGNMPNLSMLAHDEERLDAALAQVSP